MRQMFDELVKGGGGEINELDLTYGEPTVTYDATDGLSFNSTIWIHNNR